MGKSPIFLVGCATSVWAYATQGIFPEVSRNTASELFILVVNRALLALWDEFLMKYKLTCLQEEVEKTVRHLQEKLVVFTEEKQNSDQDAELIKVQG